MIRSAMTLVLVCCSVFSPSYAQEQQAQALCEQLGRQNIDCACVARRVAQHQAAAPTPAGADLVLARYAHALGQEGQPLEQAFERVATGPQGPAAILDLAAAFDRLGGSLETIEDFESQCVIAGAQPAVLEAPGADSQAQKLADACVVAAGQGAARYCACEAAQLEALLGSQQLQAYRLSFSMYPDEADQDAAPMRAEHMQVSVDRYRELEAMARSAISPRMESIRNYCSAMTWADDVSGSTTAERDDIGAGAVARGAGDGAAMAALEAEMRATAEQAQAQANAAEVAGLTDSEQSKRLAAATGQPEAMDAQAILAQGCSGAETYCACLSERFAGATQSASEGARMLAAMTLVGDGLDPGTMASAARSADQSAQMEMAQVFPMVMDIPGQCETLAAVAAADEAAQAARGSGSARERYLALCAYEQGEDGAAVCQCAADHFESNLNDSEFDLLVRVQAADLEGQGGFEGFAGEMGMSEEEAGRALMSNPRLMQAMMGVQGACMGSAFQR